MVEQLREHLTLDDVANARGAMDRATADDRAMNLLLSWLTLEQRLQWSNDSNLFHSFCCKGSTTGRTYTLTAEPQFNVYCDESDVRDGHKQQRYCAILSSQLPLPGDLIGDRLLAQKIAIETDELGFLEIAHKQGALYNGGVAAAFYSVPEPDDGREPHPPEQENALPCLP